MHIYYESHAALDFKTKQVYLPTYPPIFYITGLVVNMIESVKLIIIQIEQLAQSRYRKFALMLKNHYPFSPFFPSPGHKQKQVRDHYYIS